MVQAKACVEIELVQRLQFTSYYRWPDVVLPNGLRHTALSLAAEQGSVEVVRALLAANATNATNAPLDRGSLGYYFSAALLCAVYTASPAHTQIAKDLAAAKASVNTACAVVPLVIATQDPGNSATVSALLAAKALVDLMDEFLDETALARATFNGCYGTMRVLLRARACTEVRCGPFNRTALAIACEDVDMVAARLLVEAKAVLDARDEDGNEPLAILLNLSQDHTQYQKTVDYVNAANAAKKRSVDDDDDDDDGDDDCSKWTLLEAAMRMLQ